MNRKILSATAFLACLASAVPALAGDWNNGAGSLKDRGQAAVPVPAPIAVPDAPSGWYLRLDGGLGRESSHGASEKGIVYGAGDGTDSYSSTGAGFGSSSGWFNDGFDTKLSYGAGVGYNWGHNWRSDITLERRAGNSEYRMRGTYHYDNYVVNTAAVPAVPLYVPPAALGLDPQRIDGTTSDTTSVKSGSLLLNTYYDWKNASRITPYIGLGIGLSYLDIDRVHATSDTSCDPTEAPIPCSTKFAHRTFMANGSDTKIVWTATANAGFSYAFDDVTSVDVNYRLLYMPGTTVDMTVNGAQSRVSINEVLEHQIRAGLRWNIN